jgi:TPR repeat protein
MHFAWSDTEAKPATDRVGRRCREGSGSFLANEFPDRLRTCIAGCNGGDAPSCVIAALWLLNTAGDEAADRPRALEFLQRACASQDDPLGCFILGEELDRGANVARHDPDRARAAWRTGCEQHEDNSCAALRGERVWVERREIYRAPGP